MKILPISNCGDCPHYRWIEVNYSVECGLTYEQIRYKEIGADKALMKLFNQCPLQEYVQWKHDLTDYDVHHYDRWVDQIKEYVEEINEDFEYDREFIIKLCLSYTLQSLRNGEDLKRFQWGMINDN